MKNKYTAACFLMMVLVIAEPLPAAETWEIDKVRSKEVLDDGDSKIIDNFVSQCVRELVQASDLSSTAKTYTLILSRSVSNQAGASVQYSDMFTEVAYKHISSAFDQASRLSPERRKSDIIINLLILVDGLHQPRLADLALARLKDSDMAIRYWAVHSVTNADFAKKLRSDNLKAAIKIIEQLDLIIEDSSPEILGMMAEFAGSVEIQQGEDLLFKIADSRINKYADWTVKYELADGAILNSLYNKISQKNNPEAAKRFAQLYSYMIQRYVKGKGILSSVQKEQLASVLVGIEKSCISAILGVPQATIKRAIEGDDAAAVLLEHSRLLGDRTRPGQLAEKLNFDYGKSDDGNRIIEPLTLPVPPETAN